jgi:glyoxylase-like metal-dependent hydrolase (beta-lactamase superfamily II)
MKRHHLLAAAAVAIFALAATPAPKKAPPAPVPLALDYDRIVPGFLKEAWLPTGFAAKETWGPGVENPWGAYTAYLLAMNAKGQRTWRIENYLVLPARSQGSTMYLFEGDTAALLVDTANNTPEVEGKNDLVTVVKFLLGHENDGKTVRAKPVDFNVAITHRHGDHIGENARMSDRTVYYPDNDWTSPQMFSYYAPIREGGGATANGKGVAVGKVELGNRVIEAIDINEHTPGCSGYLDRENKMIATGDCIGSGYVWANLGMIAQYVPSVKHLREVLEPYPDIAILPAHFYQVRAGERRNPPINSRFLDRTYVDDQVKTAEGILNGATIGIPYRASPRIGLIGGYGTANTAYSWGSLFRPTDTPVVAWRAADLTKFGVEPLITENDPAIHSDFWMLRDTAGSSVYLVKGSQKALLIGSGDGTPGLKAMVDRLVGATPVEVAVLSDAQAQAGGFREFGGAITYLPRGGKIAAPRSANIKFISAGSVIDLGLDKAGKPLTFVVDALPGASAASLTLLAPSDRLLFSGDALGTQTRTGGLVLATPAAAYGKALAAWRKRTDGKYDTIYTGGNFQWTTPASFVVQTAAAVDAAVAGNATTDAQGRKIAVAPAPATPAPGGGPTPPDTDSASVVFTR